MPLLSLLLLALAAAPTPQLAVEAAVAAPGVEVELGEVRPSAGAGCQPASWEALRPVEASGQVPLRFDGRTAAGAACQGFAWARVKLLATAAVTTRALREGEPLAGAVALTRQEVLPGRHALAELPEGAVADRPLAAGAVLDESRLRVGPRPGEPVTVLLRLGALSVEQPGRAVPCLRGRACAVLPSGRRVQGRLADGRILVEVP